MRGGFLYGTYYPNANDALNAEMAQCNEIDNRSNSKKLSEQDKTIKKLLHKIELLELELNKLKEMKLGEESAFPALAPNGGGLGNTIVIEPGQVNYIYFTNGMSKRYFTACMMLQAKVCRSGSNTITDKDVTTAYELADELLKQETK